MPEEIHEIERRSLERTDFNTNNAFNPNSVNLILKTSRGKRTDAARDINA